MKQTIYNIMLAGVGGQGLMLLSTVIGTACAEKGLQIITGEQHGLSQRSGSIYVHLRIGSGVCSPLIPYGSANLLIAMEAMEALRYVEYLKDDGVVVTTTRIIHPPLETNEIAANREMNNLYITYEQIEEQLRKVTTRIVSMDAMALAEKAGNYLVENTVLLGAASGLPEFPLEGITLEKVIADTVPKNTVEENLTAFKLGLAESEKLWKL